MKSLPTLRRWLSAALTAVVAALLVVVALNGQAVRSRDAGAPAKPDPARPWPVFGGTVQRNMINLWDKNIPTKWDVAEKTNVKWSAGLGSKAYGGPIIAGGKVYIGTNNENPKNPAIKGDKGVMMCFDEATGKFLWQAVHDKLAAGRVQDWPREGICSSPFVEGDRVYYVSNRCEVICADTQGFLDGKNDGVQDEKYKGPTDADVIWRFDMIKDLGVFPHNLSTSSPLVVGDTLFLVTSNGVDEGHINIPKPGAPSFLALDKKTGKVRWKDNSPGLKIMHGQWSSPVYAEVNGKGQIIFPGGDGYMYSFAPATGQLLWKFDCNPKGAVYKLGGKGTKNDFIATPVVWENKLYIGVGQDPEHDEGVGHLWCIDITRTPVTADKDISPVKDNFDPKAPENKNSGLVWHYGGFGDPKKIGRNYYFGRTMSTCAIHDGVLYVAELAGILHCMDARTGAQYWEDDLQAATWSSPYLVDGKVYLGHDGDEVAIYEHGKQKKPIGKVDMGSKVRATPVAANGVLFVMTENTLYAIKQK